MNIDLLAGLAALDGGEDHGEAFDVVRGDRQGRSAGVEALDVVADQGGVAGVFHRFDFNRHIVLLAMKFGVAAGFDGLSLYLCSAIPEQGSLRTDHVPGGFAGSRQPVGAPGTAIGEHDVVAHLKNADRRRVPLEP